MTATGSGAAALEAPIIVTTLAQAEQAVAWLLQQSEVAMDTEGDLERKGCVCLMQLYAKGRSYIFDLHAPLAATRAYVVGQLAVLLNSPTIVKVMHDCRKDCEALFYLHGINIQRIWDTQVAHGWITMTKSVSQGTSSAGIRGKEGSLLIGMNPLLEAYGLQPNPYKAAMHKRMDREPDLWTKRPLEEAVKDYAVADVDRLLQLRAAMVAQLGSGGDAAVLHLSKAYSEWFYDEADRSYASAPVCYATAARIPAGCDLQMHLDASNNFRPRFSAFVEPATAAVAVASSAESASREQQLDEGAAAILSLFPERIRAGIEQLCYGGQQPAGLMGAFKRFVLGERRGESSTELATSSSAAGGSSSAAPARRQPIEVVVDVGRPVTVRFSGGTEKDLSEELDLQEALQRLAEAKHRLQLGGRTDDLFYGDNRTGIPGTLHRISAIRGREGSMLGLTYRIGRHVSGVGLLIMDILAQLSAGHPCVEDAEDKDPDDIISASLLLLGPPGVGKTTLLRDVSNLLADTFRKRVIVIDTSNEIAGDGDVAHACIGRARRMMVNGRDSQHSVMVEGVQNHNPEVIVVDEIGTSRDVVAAKSIAQRGVVIVGTAHGTSLETLLKNPELNPLVGGMHQVLLGDAEAKLSNAGNKTRTERKGAPTFSTLVEVLSYSKWRIHLNVARSVDAILAGREPHTQLRWYDNEGRMMMRVEGCGTNASGAALNKVLQSLGAEQGGKGATLSQLVNLAALY